MTNKIISFFTTAYATVKAFFTKNTVAVSAEETFLKPEATEEISAKAEVIADKIVKAIAITITCAITYILVMNFPITILFAMELVAVYKMIKWVSSKIIA